MSEFKYPESSQNWARRQGVTKHCDRHKIDYDIHIGCPECNKLRKIVNLPESNKFQKPDIFANIIWPDSTKRS